MKKIIFYYCFVISLFISISGILTSQNVTALLFQLLFIPITIYFAYSVFVQFFDKSRTYLQGIKPYEKVRDKKSNPIVSSIINRGALFITIVLFILLLVTSIMRVMKKSHQEVKKSSPIILSPSPKIIITPYLTVRNEYRKDNINVRQSSSSASKIIGELDTEKKYQIVSKKNQWYEIVYDKGINGFVNETFVHPAPF